MSEFQPMLWPWTGLSNSELDARLRQRGVPWTQVVVLVAHRDGAGCDHDLPCAVRIARALKEDDRG